ncbi:MAG: 5-bromo-4-chloroindolyl phosphate hydrolysis family protein [Pseudomonadota bacterium]
MAEPYGGKYSPDGTPKNARDGLSLPKGGKIRSAARGFRVRFLFFASFFMFLAAIVELFAGNLIQMLWEMGAFALMFLSVFLLRGGILAAEAYNMRKVARPPSIPRKLFAAIVAGTGVFAAAWQGWGQGLFEAIGLGGLAGAALLFSFGLDPMKKKGMEGMNEFEQQRVAKAVEKAEALVAEMIDAAGRFGDRPLKRRVETLAHAARDMFRTIENDPRDLTQSRKFLSVYLKGARDATIKFADLYQHNRDTNKRADYEALLSDLETSFQEKREVLLLDDRTDLDVEIEVLRDRLKQEGLKAKI